MEQNGTKNLAICATGGTCTIEEDKPKKDPPEIMFHQQMSRPHVREYRRMAAMQKSRLWGRG